MCEVKKQPHGKLRGFTLIEMIVVLAIIAILTGVLVPTMRGYFAHSRINAANANAKVLFNSLQTLCQEYEFNEMAAESSAFYGSTTTLSGDSVAIRTGSVFLRSPNQSASSPLYGEVSARIVANGSSVSDDISQALNAGLNDEDDPSSFRNRLLRLFEDAGSIYWVAYIEDYQVRAVVCADTATTDYMGAYPIKLREVNDFAKVINASGTYHMENFEITIEMIVPYAEAAWSTST